MFRQNDRQSGVTRHEYGPEYDDFVAAAGDPFSSDIDERVGGPPGDLETGAARAPGMATASWSARQGTVIGPSTTFTGTLSSEGPVTIIGAMEGEIIAAGDVSIAPGAVVRARVQAINLQIAGQFRGSVACTQRFEAMGTGSVQADILAPAIVVHEGATVNGRFKIRNGGDGAGLDDAFGGGERENGGAADVGFEGSE